MLACFYILSLKVNTTPVLYPRRIGHIRQCAKQTKGLKA